MLWDEASVQRTGCRGVPILWLATASHGGKENSMSTLKSVWIVVLDYMGIPEIQDYPGQYMEWSMPKKMAL